MEQNVQKKINELTAKAKQLTGRKPRSLSAVRNGSSLHKVIKTKEQAATFMKLLKST